MLSRTLVIVSKNNNYVVNCWAIIIQFDKKKIAVLYHVYIPINSFMLIMANRRAVLAKKTFPDFKQVLEYSKPIQHKQKKRVT